MFTVHSSFFQNKEVRCLKVPAAYLAGYPVFSITKCRYPACHIRCPAGHLLDIIKAGISGCRISGAFLGSKAIPPYYSCDRVPFIISAGGWWGVGTGDSRPGGTAGCHPHPQGGHRHRWADESIIIMPGEHGQPYSMWSMWYTITDDAWQGRELGSEKISIQHMFSVHGITGVQDCAQNFLPQE